jgi:hypothetical protein
MCYIRPVERADWALLGSLVLYAFGAVIALGLVLAVIRVALWGFGLL